MTVQRSKRFDTDLERQFRWYLLEADLDPADALALAARFAEAVDAALNVLGRSPEVENIDRRPRCVIHVKTATGLVWSTLQGVVCLGRRLRATGRAEWVARGHTLLA